MKKLIFTLVFAFVTAVSISSCTEQEIKPKDDGGMTDCYPGKPGCPKTV